jgi:hypothetical protein
LVANCVLVLLDRGSGPSKQTINEDKQSLDRKLFVNKDVISISKEDKPNRSDNLFLNAGEDLDSKDDFIETDAEFDLSFVISNNASLYPDKDISPSKNKDRAINTPKVVTALKLKSKLKSIPKSKTKTIGKVAVNILISSVFIFYANLLGLLLELYQISLVRF